LAGAGRYLVCRSRRRSMITRRKGETTLSAAIFLSSEDRPVSPEAAAGRSERRYRAERTRVQRTLMSK
jgi:hypothetical protein